MPWLTVAVVTVVDMAEATPVATAATQGIVVVTQGIAGWVIPAAVVAGTSAHTMVRCEVMALASEECTAAKVT